LGGKLLEAIDRDMVEVLINAKLAEGSSNATVNRTLALVVQSFARVFANGNGWREYQRCECSKNRRAEFAT